MLSVSQLWSTDSRPVWVVVDGRRGVAGGKQNKLDKNRSPHALLYLSLMSIDSYRSVWYVAVDG